MTTLIRNAAEKVPERHARTLAPLLAARVSIFDPETPELVELPEPYISKRALADHYEMSTRWVEQRMSEGLPHGHMDGRARFVLGEADAWLREHGHLKAAR